MANSIFMVSDVRVSERTNPGDVYQRFFGSLDAAKHYVEDAAPTVMGEDYGDFKWCEITDNYKSFMGGTANRGALYYASAAAQREGNYNYMQVNEIRMDFEDGECEVILTGI